MGVVEGMYLDDALAQYGHGFRELGEGEGQLVARVAREWDAVLKLGYANVVVCTHGGVITRFVKHLYEERGYGLHESLTREDLKVPFNTSITVVDYDWEKGVGKIQCFGNTAHLGGNFEVKEQLLR